MERIVEVAVPVPLDRVFHYRAVGDIAERLRPGMRISVPFGRQRLDGYCVGFAQKAEVERLKDVESVLDSEPLLDEGQIEMARWIARTYCAGIGEALEAMLPGAVKRQVKVAHRLDVRLVGGTEAIGKSAKRESLLATLRAAGGVMERDALLKAAGCGPAALKALLKTGMVAVEKVEVAPWELQDPVKPGTGPELTAEQRKALGRIEPKIDAGEFGAFLLFGVTGSGKTEVYLRAIQKVVSAGRQAIVLVPEIALTPQTTRRFRERFARVAVMHSGMGDGERHAYWRAIAHGKAEVVVGARSAVFAPTRKLGLIVVDEEHEPTFKQANSPRYHARDAAVWRARRENVPVILGSATPSLESFAQAARGAFELLELPRRIRGRRMPTVDVIDMKQEVWTRPGYHVMSRRLEQMVTASLGRSEQVMLFLNRRGFSTYFVCPKCGEIPRCTQCDITLTFHRGRGRAMCHYCGREVEVPATCPECQGGPLKAMGMGTERVEEEVKTLFPSARMWRMDSDTMRTRGAYEEVVRKLNDGEIDVLVGTQMIAKGHDFPGVTLVGVIGADTSLALADFRARERTFQLLAQVAGRAGRGEKGGEVVVQTCRPDDYSIQFASRHDYMGFAKRELADRKRDAYPPFGRLARVVLEGADLRKVTKRAQEIGQALMESTSGKEVKVLGPAECPVARIKGQHRWHVVLKGPPGLDFAEVLAPVREKTRTRTGVRLLIDVDPVSLI